MTKKYNKKNTKFVTIKIGPKTPNSNGLTIEEEELLILETINAGKTIEIDENSIIKKDIEKREKEKLNFINKVTQI